jgi:regulator of replication initiation timing
MALSGIIIVLLSIYIPKVKIAEVTDKIIDAKESKLILVAKVNNLESQVDSLKDTFGLSIQENKELKVENLYGELDDVLSLLKIERIKQKSITERLEVLNTRSVEIFRWSIITLFTGLAMAFFGFWLWYSKVQKLHDFILKSECISDKSNKTNASDS